MAASLTPRWGSEFDVTMIAEEVMANIGVAVKIGTNPMGVILGTDGAVCFGILQTAASAVGQRVRVRPLIGETFVRANAAFAIGARLKCGASDGEVETTTSGESIGIALEPALAAGSLVVAQLYPNKL